MQLKIEPQQIRDTNRKNNYDLIDEDNHTAGENCKLVKKILDQASLFLLAFFFENL